MIVYATGWIVAGITTAALVFCYSRLREHKEASITDTLTGLYNRRGFERIGNRATRRAARYAGDGSRYLAVIMIDVDTFKPINDRYGHNVGDRVLKKIANHLTHRVRAGSDDVSARIGGDEFVVLAGCDDPTDAWQIAERIRAAIADNPVRLPAKRAFSTSRLITASIGVAVASLDAAHSTGCELSRSMPLSESGADFMIRELCKLADEAMYDAKRAGGDRVEVRRYRYDYERELLPA